MLSISKLISEFTSLEELKPKLLDMARRIERHINSDNKVIIYNDGTKALPSKLKKGDIVLDTVANPGYLTVVTWDGKKKVNQPIAASAVATSQVFSEIPSGSSDGVNDTYDTVEVPAKNSTRVFVDGKRKLPNIDYVETPVGIKFHIPPAAGSSIALDYSIR